MKLVLPSAEADRLRHQAETAYPNECCGLLIGRGEDGGPWQVEQLVPALNVAPDPRRHFELDPTLHLHWQRNLRGTGRRIIGHYHSHPDGQAEPSKTDEGGISEAGLVWLIVPVALGDVKGVMRAWRPDQGGAPFVEVEVTVA